MATKTKAENTETTEATETTEQATKSTVTVKVTGACRVKLNGENLQYGSEFELDESELSRKGIGYLFAQKLLVVKDDEAKTREIIEAHRAGAKKDPNAGKSIQELENGGDIK